MPSTSISLGLGPCFQERWERGYAAGPWSTLPSRRNREPWHGQSKLASGWPGAALASATEQPRCEQLIAKTLTLPWFLTTNPPKASSPDALSPPPSAMMNAELGLRGASNLTASPSCSWLMGVCSAMLMGPFFWPLGGAGQKNTRMGSNPVITVAVMRLASHQPRNDRRVIRLGAAASAIRLKS